MSNEKTLIAYYSRAGQNHVSGAIVDLPQGNGSILAGFAADITGGDLFEIETVKKYSADYAACVKEAVADMRSNARPQLATQVENMDAYNTVVLVYPNWCGTMPMPVYTFLESYDFSGKTILPLCTHEGSGLGTTESDIARECPQAKVGQGLAVKGSVAAVSEPDVRTWLEGTL